MSRYFEAIKRGRNEAHVNRPVRNFASVVEIQEQAQEQPRSSAVVAVNVTPGVLGTVARTPAVRSLNERVAPLANLGNPVRLMISGCRSGDGASSVAAGMAIDLSQRLGLRTLLLDAHLRHPMLYRLLSANDPMSAQPLNGAAVQINSTDWPRLDVASCIAPTESKEFFDAVETLLAGYPIAVIDLGVLRLDARLLRLVRPTDPVLLVVRYGHTEKQDLNTTVSALRAANCALGGVLFNGVRESMPKSFRRLFGQGVSQ